MPGTVLGTKNNSFYYEFWLLLRPTMGGCIDLSSPALGGRGCTDDIKPQCNGTPWSWLVHNPSSSSIEGDRKGANKSTDKLRKTYEFHKHNNTCNHTGKFIKNDRK